MTVVLLFALAGLLLLGGGFSRGNSLAAVAGAFLLADAMVLYIIFGPAAAFARTLFH